jgi:carbonic anhydrase
MKTLRISLLTGLAVVLAASAFAAAGPTAPTDSMARLLREASLALLKEGNARYVAGRPQHPNLDAARRTNTVAEGQEPFAAVLACSDSREPVELIFDRGIGDLFVVRVAGNVAGPSELASVEYAAGHLHTPLLVVMGHSRCGAVTAVVQGSELHGHLQQLAERIQPAADQARTGTNNLDEAVPRAIQANVWQAVADVLTQSSIVRDQVVSGRVQVVGALYDLESGVVTWLGTHPAQDKLLSSPRLAETSVPPATPGAEHSARPAATGTAERPAPSVTTAAPHH